MAKLKFSQIVRAWRVARQLTKTAAARRLGVPYRTFQSWELGERTPRGLGRQLIETKLSARR